MFSSRHSPTPTAPRCRATPSGRPVVLVAALLLALACAPTARPADQPAAKPAQPAAAQPAGQSPAQSATQPAAKPAEPPRPVSLSAGLVSKTGVYLTMWIAQQKGMFQ